MTTVRRRTEIVTHVLTGAPSGRNICRLQRAVEELRQPRFFRVETQSPDV